MLRTISRGANGAPPTIHFSFKGSNGSPSRSAGEEGNGVPRTMEECEGGDEGNDGATPPRRPIFINPNYK